MPLVAYVVDLPDPPTLLLLLLISLLAGVGITAIGPGGVLVTIALFTFTDLAPAEIAGTAIVTHIGTGILGTIAYLRSGQLREPFTRRLALTMAIAALVGTPLGVLTNTRLSTDQFGLLLAGLVVLVGISVLVQERRRPARTETMPAPRPLVHGTLGFTAALVSGLFGLGGPMISVPMMVMLDVPMLSALAAAQGQSLVVAGVGMGSYLAQGAISWPLVLVTGIPQLAGVWLGWRIAHAVPTRPLKIALACTLIALGPAISMTR